MRFASQTSSDGVTEQLFTLGEIPGVLWTPEDAVGARPLILMGHGGGQHKKAQGIVSRARRFVAEGGFAVAAIDAPNHGDRPKSEEFTRVATQIRARMAAGEAAGPLVAAMHDLLAGQAVAEWQAVITATQELDHVGVGPTGYCGMSMGCGLGVPLVAAESRIRAAVLGLLGVHGLAETAARITVPVQFLLQWDDDLVPRGQGLALFDALASAEKTLHANSGKHGEIPEFETGSSLRFLTRNLALARATSRSQSLLSRLRSGVAVRTITNGRLREPGMSTDENDRRRKRKSAHPYSRSSCRLRRVGGPGKRLRERFTYPRAAMLKMPADNGIAAKPSAQIITTAYTTMESAVSVRMYGSFTDSGKR